MKQPAASTPADGVHSLPPRDRWTAHGVQAEVPFEDYLYYRKRCVELGG